MNHSIRSLGIVGVGLIGGSLALSLKRVMPELKVLGYGRNTTNLDWAKEHGVITDRAAHLTDLGDCDLIVIATPLGAMESVIDELAPHISSHTLLTDVGSAKSAVVEQIKRVAAKHPEADLLDRFVPGHPIAGREKSGAAAAKADLFDAHRVILTPIHENTDAAVKQVADVWELAGATVQNMTPDHHDEVLAATSHLPHLLAYQLVSTLAAMEDKREIFAYAAGGFRDFTRIAASDPVMWRDICLQNRDAILPVLDQYMADLKSMRDTLATANSGERLENVFSAAQAAKKRSDAAK
ncbi:MAG: prephenate dehydrogenase/arogenate dehydrogenase family protein [Gammaproteobacteria bacterium]|nr:prephenate dehydrogenase/arogenate dehydrogenase family protein [Gammaproteobacteria bacterium]